MNAPATCWEDVYRTQTARITELERDNAALLKRLDSMQKSHFSLSKDYAALREDKARLDWLMTHEGGAWIYWACEMGQWTPEVAASRAAIDAARKEAQP